MKTKLWFAYSVVGIGILLLTLVVASAVLWHVAFFDDFGIVARRLLGG